MGGKPLAFILVGEGGGENFIIMEKVILSNFKLYFVILMVKLKLKVGPKGQIVLPKMVRDKLGIKPRSYVIADLEENELTLKGGLDIEELLEWLRKSRKPVAKLVSKYSIEDESLETLS